jgi:hypothetical protein
MVDKTTTAEQVAEFAATLLDLDRGHIHDDAGDRLREVVTGVERFGGKGKVTLTIEVTQHDPETFEDTGLLMFEGRVDAVIPRPKRAASLMYATGVDGQVTRQDPKRDDPRD